MDYIANSFPGSNILQQLQAAVAQAKTDGGGRIWVQPGIYTADTDADGPLVITGRNIEICSARRAAFITFAGAGPHIIIGSDTEQAYDIGFHGLLLEGAPEAYLFWTRWHRGLRFYDFEAYFDGFIILGDDTLSNGSVDPADNKGSYVVEFYNGCELTQTKDPNPDATLHAVYCKNFRGQWVNFGTFCEGGGISGVHGFYVAENIQQHIDDLHIVAGYWSRFDRNYDFTDNRVTNLKFVGHQSEGALTHALHIEVTSATDQAPSHVGAEGVDITGGRWNGIGNTIYIGHNRNQSGVETIGLISITGAQLTGDGASVTTPILVESPTQYGVIRQLQIIGFNGYFNPSDTSQDMILLKGSSNPGTLTDVLVDDVTAWSSNANALRSVVRVEGTGNTRVAVGGNISGRNASKLVDDQSGLLTRNGWFYKSGSSGFAAVPANSEGGAATFAVSGAKVGDPVLGVITAGTRPAGLQFRFDVTAAGVVSVTPINITGASISSGTIGSLTFDLWVDGAKH